MDTQKPFFEALWGRFDDFELQEPVILCPPAQIFSEWVNGLLESVSQEPSIVSINQAKILLQDKWHDWRSAVPQRHRNHLGNRGHTCLFQVYEQAYNQLRILELSLTPPMLFIPPPPPQIPQVFLGEEE